MVPPILDGDFLTKALRFIYIMALAKKWQLW